MRQGKKSLPETIELFIELAWMLAAITTICEFGERLNDSSERIRDVFDRLAWYLFPCDVQHKLANLIMAAHRPFELYVFGSISCSRSTLKNVSESFYKPDFELKLKTQSIHSHLDVQQSLLMVHGSPAFWELKYTEQLEQN